MSEVKDKIIWEKQVDLLGLEEIASEIAQILQNSETFCLWLSAPLGGGKTSFAGALMHALGLPEEIPVSSPTFAYINEYFVGEKQYAHMDLYRLSEGFNTEELGLYEDHSFSGFIVEWPSRIEGESILNASHKLDISYSDDRSSRIYRLTEVSESSSV